MTCRTGWVLRESEQVKERGAFLFLRVVRERCGRREARSAVPAAGGLLCERLRCDCAGDSGVRQARCRWTAGGDRVG